MRRVPLNSFQRVMLQWSDVYPYNACHLYCLSGAGDPQRFREAARQALAAADWGRAVIEADGRYASFGPCDDVEVRQAAAESPGGVDLDREVAAELNRPFDRPECRPIRFVFAADGAAACHWIAAVYDHWTADSVAMRLLMRRILAEYLGGPCEDGGPLHVCDRPLLGALREPLSLWRRWRTAVNTVARSLLERQPIKPPDAGREGREVCFQLFRGYDGMADGLWRFARNRGATVHDVFLAVLHQVLGRHLPCRRSLTQCDKIALGSIVDIRGEAAGPFRESLGVLLGFWTLRERVGAFRSLSEAVERLAARTRQIKARRAHLDSLVSIGIGAAAWPWLPRPWRARLMRRTMPLTAGVTNVVVRDRWLEQSLAGTIVEYARAAPLGPTVPLVLSPTTMGNRLTIGFTYAASEFTEPQIAAIIDDVLCSLRLAAAESNASDPAPKSIELRTKQTAFP